MSFSLVVFFCCCCSRTLHCAVVPAPPTVQAVQLTAMFGPQHPRPPAPSVPQRSLMTEAGNVHSLEPHSPVIPKKMWVETDVRSSVSCIHLYTFWHVCPFFWPYTAHDPHPTSRRMQKSWQAEEEEKEKGEAAFSRGGLISPEAGASCLIQHSDNQRRAWWWYQHYPSFPGSA